MNRIIHRGIHSTRITLSRKEVNHEILKLVPLRSRVSIIDNEGKKNDNVQLKDFLKRKLDPKNEKLTIVNYRPSIEPANKDPSLICKVMKLAENNKSGEGGNNQVSKGKKSTSPKTTAVKEKNIPISWSIGQADLLGQKKNAIESILSRGHKAIVELGRGGKRSRSISDLDLQKRQWLIEKVKKICEDELEAQEYKSPAGDERNIMTLYYYK